MSSHFPFQPHPLNESTRFFPPTLLTTTSVTSSVTSVMPQSNQDRFLRHHHQQQHQQSSPSDSESSTAVVSLRDPLFAYTTSKYATDKTLVSFLKGFMPNEHGESRILPLQPLLPPAAYRPAKRKASLEEPPNHGEQEDGHRNHRIKIQDCYAAALIPKENLFLLELLEKKDMIRDQLDTVVKRAREEISLYKGYVSDAMYGCFNSSAIRVLFIFCEKLKVNLQTIFCAMEIFDKHTMVMDSFNNLQLNEMKVRLRKQVPLRIVTSIHIAAKLHSDSLTQDVTISNILALLKSIGQEYDKEAIVKAEFRLFSTLKFRLTWPQPLEIVEATLASIQLPVEVRVETYSNCICLLLFAYQYHHELYDELWDIKYNDKFAYPGNRRKANVLGKGLTAARKEFRGNTECDIILRAGAIVATSLLFYTKTTESTSHKDYSSQIANLLKIPVENIFDLSIAFLKLIHKDASTGFLP